MAEIAMDTTETKKKSMMMLIAAIIVSLFIGLLVGFYAGRAKADTSTGCAKLSSLFKSTNIPLQALDQISEVYGMLCSGMNE